MSVLDTFSRLGDNLGHAGRNFVSGVKSNVSGTFLYKPSAKPMDYNNGSFGFDTGSAASGTDNVSVTGSAAVATPGWEAALNRAYEGQRGQAEATNEEERLRAQERLSNRLASQGLEKGSGILEKGQMLTDIASQKALAGRLGALDIAQAQDISGKGFQMDLANLNNSLAEGRIRLQDTLQDENDTEKSIADSYFARGQSGDVIDPAKLELLQTTNPRAYAAYQAGVAGKSLDEYNREYDRETQYRNALIMRLDPKSTSFVTDLNGILSELGYEGSLIAAPGAATGGVDYSGYSDAELAKEIMKYSGPTGLGLTPEGKKTYAALQLEQLRRRAA